jgi:hypothetical protein
MESPYVRGIIHNFYDRIRDDLSSMSQSLYAEITERMNSPEVDILILMGVLIVVSTYSMVSLINLMFAIKMKRENILFLFLDIP